MAEERMGRPDLYIAGQKMQTTNKSARPALAGVSIDWGTDSRFDTGPASTISGELLIRDGVIPSWLNVGATVALMEPTRARCLFAGKMEPLTARPDDIIEGAMRVSFTASSPLSELQRHNVTDLDWPFDEAAAARLARLRRAMPRGWTLDGADGWDWITTGRQKYQSVPWLDLAERYVRGYLQRIHDTSYYLPGVGLRKRITITNERAKGAALGSLDAGRWGTWRGGQLTGATGVASLPLSAVGTDMEWEKTPEDVITDVNVSTTGGALPSDESTEFEFLMDAYVDNSKLQDTYGYRQLKVETSLAPKVQAAVAAAIRDHIVPYWLDTQTQWRPTKLTIPDSREIDIAPLLNLVAVDSRHMAVVSVPDIPATFPAPIRSFVQAGRTTWTGKKWVTELTLGRTL